MSDKQILIEMLNEVNKVTERHNLEYFLAYGSLIGAVRDHGLIPWDTEIDIWVPIKSYEKFVKLLSDEISVFFEVQTPSIPEYELFFSRVSVKGQNHHDLHIDIFPLVGIPKNSFAQKFFLFKSVLLNKLYYVKRLDHTVLYKNRPKRRIQASVIKTFLKPISDQYLYRRLSILAFKYDYSRSKYYYTFGGSYGSREVFESRYFSEILKVKFDKTYALIPKYYNEILSQIYGDYMTPKKDNYLS